MSMFSDVKEFHKFFGHGISTVLNYLNPERLKFRIMLMDEELQEYKDAMAQGDIIEAADALADLVYVTLGTAVEMGIPFDKVWDAVQQANMEKAVYPRHGIECKLLNSPDHAPERCDCGAVLYTDAGKTKKPEGWIPPNDRIKLVLGLT
jgi:predicted HAD superfamily Cof-like phosphohydrolase